MKYSGIKKPATLDWFFCIGAGNETRPCYKETTPTLPETTALISGIKKPATLDWFFVLERETRLELATPTLARLCSTN